MKADTKVHPSKNSLTLPLSQREREPFSGPLYAHTPYKTLRKVCVWVNSHQNLNHPLQQFQRTLFALRADFQRGAGAGGAALFAKAAAKQVAGGFE